MMAKTGSLSTHFINNLAVSYHSGKETQARAYKFEEVVVLVGQQGFLLAFHVADRVLEEAVLFAHNFIEKGNRLSAFRRAFHARRHKRVVDRFWCCLTIGSIPFALVFLFVGPAAKPNV